MQCMQNNKQAYMWLSLSLALTTNAETMDVINVFIKSLESCMTKEQIAEAQDMVAEWHKKHETVIRLEYISFVWNL